MKKRCLCLALFVSVLFLIQNISRGQTPATEPEPRPSERFDQFVQRMEQGDVQLLMVGDSITHRWEPYPTYPELCGQEVWNEFYGNRHAMNFGMGGDRTGNVIWRLQNAPLDKISPKVCVLLIGTNNLRPGVDHSPADTAAGITKCVDILRDHFPEARIILMEIFPREKLPTDPTRLKVDETNTILRQTYAGGKVPRVVLLSVADLFLNEDGTLKMEYLPDGLHPNLAGYRLWAEAMEPEIKTGLGE